MYSLGIDIGSTCTKGAIFDGMELVTEVMPTGWNLRQSGTEIAAKLAACTGIKIGDAAGIVSTGYGRDSLPFALKKVTEITCHARGAHFLDPGVRTVIDIGGQDSKAIAVDSSGGVVEFIMNDRCAAGTGRFLQVMAHVLGAEVDMLEGLARGAEPVSISSMCAVFAESEVISLLANGVTKESIAAGILESIAVKVTHLTGRINVKGNIMFTGGVSQNSIIRGILEMKIGAAVTVHPLSQFAGAVGAAVIGFDNFCRDSGPDGTGDAS